MTENDPTNAREAAAQLNASDTTGDEITRPTYRERRMARADRLEGWAEGREAKAQAAQAGARAIADMIPFGQPILSGHHSEGRHRRDLARMTGGMDRAAEHAEKARGMHSRADGIRAAADRAIYSDDPDAVEQLTARIATLEALRDARKVGIAAYNASVRRGAPDPDLLHESDRRDLEHPALRSFVTRPNGQMRPGRLTNLTADIARNRTRLEALR